ncbi:fimbrial protein [Burkholderia ubonensis]|uniref:fimbrial protein n=1 Tax=Burkholderia ubonensis TaxID=101571 RepID=UPI0012FAAD49|nr:fimbrial protein [Burkholderia ubonensis]
MIQISRNLLKTAYRAASVVLSGLLLTVALPVQGQTVMKCQSVPPSEGPGIHHYVDINFPTSIRVAPGTPNGAVIATVTAEFPYACPANPNSPPGYDYWFIFPGQSWLTTNYPNVGKLTTLQNYREFETFGFRVTNLDTGRVMAVHHSLQEWAPSHTNAEPLSKVLRLKIEMIKLNDNIYNFAKIRNPNAAVGIEVRNRGKAARAITVDFKFFKSGGSLVVTPNSCTVTTPNVNVTLPPVSAGKLNQAGATAGDTGFNIGLSCQSGSNVYVTLTDLTDPSNTTTNLSLVPGSTASDVKLRILRNGNPVGFGPDSADPGNTNQWLVGPSSSTSSIPLSAQYVSTGRVTPGTVKGAATFTLSYQ